jgi:hypothetical protein
MDQMKYQIAITIKTTAGMRPIRFFRLFTKLGFFFSFVFLTGSLGRLMVFLFDIVVFILHPYVVEDDLVSMAGQNMVMIWW